MNSFMNEDFMLKNETAKKLFHNYAEKMPLVDYHCHISPKEIYEDRRYNNLAEVWLGGRNDDGSYFGDHYKWRVMRSNAVPEDQVTGGADPYDKFVRFAEALEMAIGNPMYHWCNLELKKYFGINEPLTAENAKAIWDKANEMLLTDPSLSVRGIIRQSNVKYIGTTDDPVDTLEWHEKIAADPDIDFMVCPSFRPDKAINISKAGFKEYIISLAHSVGKDSLDSAEDVMAALDERIDYFKKHGCRASDHGIDFVPFKLCSIEEANEIFAKSLRGETLSAEEVEKYQTTILLHLARKYHKENIVMEIHYSCTRNVNQRMFGLEGPDTGFDMIAKSSCGDQLAMLLSELDKSEELPKTIIFSLDHNDFNVIGTCMGAFQSAEVPSKIQMGAAWWFLDTRDGMEEQMRSLANLGLLGNFVGMLTDSRSFLSYTRHDYFRRIMCNLIGQWVEDGEYPANESSLKKIVEGISYNNAVRYFNID
ncbi:MAG: glucuronate isomerase [Eubacterium sp.]|jgi:glucuronate isomerase|nr:glucuronate isomerase [Eubacterium sp.]HBE10651.1 glucuronate isomerase [Lachnospiraceae bacterium]